MKPEHWATSQSIFRYVYCWLLGFLLFPRVSTLEAVGNALGDSHLHFTNSVLLLELKLYFMWNKIFLASSQKKIKEIKTKNSIRSSENMFSVVCSPPPLSSHSLLLSTLPCIPVLSFVSQCWRHPAHRFSVGPRQSWRGTVKYLQCIWTYADTSLQCTSAISFLYFYCIICSYCTASCLPLLLRSQFIMSFLRKMSKILKYLWNFGMILLQVSHAKERSIFL